MGTRANRERVEHRPDQQNAGLLGFVWVVGGPDTAPDLGKRVPADVTSLAHEGGRAKEKGFRSPPTPSLAAGSGSRGGAVKPAAP